MHSIRKDQKEIKMQNLESLIGDGSRRGGAAAYSLPLRVKIVAVEQEKTQSQTNMAGASGSAASSLRCSLADESRYVTGICYNKSLYETIRRNEGKGVSIRQFQLKNTVVLLTSNTVIGRTAAPVIPQSIETAARAAIVPIDAPVSPIKTLLSSPEKSIGSFEGTVVTLEMEKTVMAFGKEATVRNLTMQDSTGSVKVALWRDKANINLNVGDFVECKDFVRTKFDDKPVMSTTKQSCVQKKDQPSSTITTTLVSIEESDDQYLHIMCIDASAPASTSTYIFDKRAFDVKDEEEVLQQLPLQAILTVKGQYVQSFDSV